MVIASRSDELPELLSRLLMLESEAISYSTSYMTSVASPSSETAPLLGEEEEDGDQSSPESFTQAGGIRATSTHNQNTE